MKINSDTSNPLGYPQIPTASPVAIGAKSDIQKNTSSVPLDSGAAATEKAAENPSLDVTGDMDKMKALVKRLMGESSIRPEAVAGRSAEDPVKAFNDDQLRDFIAALQKAEE